MRTSKALNTAIEEYQAITRHLFETGVGLIEVDRTGVKNSGRISLHEHRRFIKALQRELGTPRIVAERIIFTPLVREANSHKWIKEDRTEVKVELALPKIKRLRVVVAPLLLVAEKLRPGRYPPVVIYDQGVSAWRFIFRGEDGLAIYDGFIDRCRTDPICRIAIGTHRYPRK